MSYLDPVVRELVLAYDEDKIMRPCSPRIMIGASASLTAFSEYVLKYFFEIDENE